MRYAPLLLLAAMACSKLPTAPSTASTPPLGLNQESELALHGLTAVVDVPLAPGQIAFICITQERQYCQPNGACRVERDRYISDEPCPTVPID